jgi:hypothetical protein
VRPGCRKSMERRGMAHELRRNPARSAVSSLRPEETDTKESKHKERDKETKMKARRSRTSLTKPRKVG